jgi:hypothetical protein
MRQFRMLLQRRLVPPSRMNVKEPPIPRRTKKVNTQAAFFFPRRPLHVPQRFLNCTLLSLPRVQPHKRISLQGFLLHLCVSA